MKIKSGERNISAMSKFDVKGVRELLVAESKFITQLLDKRSVPVTGNNESGMIILQCLVVVFCTFCN